MPTPSGPLYCSIHHEPRVTGARSNSSSGVQRYCRSCRRERQRGKNTRKTVYRLPPQPDDEPPICHVHGIPKKLYGKLDPRWQCRTCYSRYQQAYLARKKKRDEEAQARQAAAKTTTTLRHPSPLADMDIFGEGFEAPPLTPSDDDWFGRLLSPSPTASTDTSASTSPWMTAGAGDLCLQNDWLLDEAPLPDLPKAE